MARSTVQIRESMLATHPPTIPELEKTSLVASGDQSGRYPRSVIRRTDSPVAPMTKMPPPSRSERKAMCSPSGEKAGWRSSAADEPSVRLIALPPPMRCR